MEENVVPSKNYGLAPSYWQLSHMLRPRFEPGSGKRQHAVSGSALDHTAVRAGPFNSWNGAS